MKQPLWAQTLAWIVAILIAVLLALANLDHRDTSSPQDLVPHGSFAPR